jgi:hypothetical protein
LVQSVCVFASQPPPPPLELPLLLPLLLDEASWLVPSGEPSATSRDTGCVASWAQAAMAAPRAPAARTMAVTTVVREALDGMVACASGYRNYPGVTTGSSARASDALR